MLGSPVRFGFSSIFGKTETETGPSWLEILKTETETVRDRFTAVLHGFSRLQDRLQTGLVYLYYISYINYNLVEEYIGYLRGAGEMRGPRRLILGPGSLRCRKRGHARDGKMACGVHAALHAGGGVRAGLGFAFVPFVHSGWLWI